MTAHLQRVTATFTSAIVLMVSLYCACYGAMVAQASTIEEAPAKATSHCHSYQTEKAQPQPGSQSPEKDHDPSCQHCDQLSVAPEAAPRFDGQQASQQWVSAFIPLFWSASLLNPPVQPRFLSGDLPPPRPASTLLSLHCALVI